MSEADKHIARFAEQYEQICARHGPWRVTALGKALLKDFSPLHIAKLCEMFDEETPVNSGGRSRNKTSTAAAERLGGKRPLQANSERPQMPPPPPREPAHQLRQPTRLQCDDVTNNHADAGAMPMRRRVLVPLSGGVASTACLWWALQRPEFDVHIVHLVGVERSNKYEQMLALVQMARYARALDGKPLAAQFAQEQRKISQKHTLANVCDDMDATIAADSGADAKQVNLKRLAALQHDRFTILPMPTQPYTLENCGALSAKTLQSDKEPLKHHPLSYALMYRQVLRSACALQCDDIVWGLFDDARSVVEMLHPLFSSSLRRHQNWFPFADRHESFATFVAMSERSDQIWSAYTAPIFDPTSADAQQSSAQRRKTSSRKPSQTDRALADDADKPVRPIVPKMTGPSLAPDAAQYATTCQQYMQSRAHDARNDDDKQEKAHRDASVPKGHADNVRMMRWCGACVDCAVWRDVALNRKRATTTTAAAVRKVELTTQHTLLDAYNQLLNEAKNNQSHARRIVDVKRRSEAQKEAQKYRASLLQESNERKRSRESIGGVYSCHTNKRVKVSVQDERDDEEDEADAEEEGNDDDDDEDDDNNSQDEEEEEDEELADDEDNDEEEQDGAIGHENDFLEDDDDLDEDDNEDDDDEDDDDADDDFDDDFDYE